jgi:hypothetical protein
MAWCKVRRNGYCIRPNIVYKGRIREQCIYLAEKTVVTDNSIMSPITAYLRLPEEVFGGESEGRGGYVLNIDKHELYVLATIGAILLVFFQPLICALDAQAVVVTGEESSGGFVGFCTYCAVVELLLRHLFGVFVSHLCVQ